MTQTATIGQQTAFEVEMLHDALAWHKTNGSLDSELAVKLAAKLALIEGGQTSRSMDAGEIKRGREAGSAAGNQYGTFKVHSASEAQVRFLAKLLATREHGNIVVPTTLDGISKKTASALIEDLLRMPETAAAQANVPMASDKQVTFITSLLSARVHDVDYSLVDHTALTLPQAKVMINHLLAQPVKPLVTKETPKDEREDGMYIKDGVVYKVQYNLAKTHLYAKRLVQHGEGDASFEYAGGLNRLGLNAEHKMTLDQAKEYGALYGTCCNCARTLTDEKSIEAGIGPICAKKFGA